MELNHIYSEIQGEYMDTLLAHFTKCLELWTAINDFINEKVGVENNRSRVDLMIDLFNELITFFKGEVCTEYYEKFKHFRNAVFGFFENIDDYKNKLSTLLVDNFQIIGN